MNFVQAEFLAFFAIVFAGVVALRRARRAQNALLVAASCVFYGWVHPWFLLLLAASAGTDYAAALAMARWPARKDAALLLSLAVNLGLLAYFKYFDFFVENVAAAIEALGGHAGLVPLGIALPVGISFYTFQTLSYTIDVWRGELAPRRDPLDYFLFVLFFPQLVAGPIERAERLLVQVERDRTLSAEGVASGLTLACWGAVQKLVVADTLAPYVDKVFVLEEPAGPLVWAGALGFSIQVYADFSGYTDLARGTARMLGFELSENFRSPYLAATTPEFWQRWHMSFSSWIRDYLFSPLLGSAATVSAARFVAATYATFALIGLWHGASWNFLLFGLWHGTFMVLYSLLARPIARVPRVALVPLHFLTVSLVGSLLFRETSLARLAAYARLSPTAADPDEWLATVVVVGMTVVVSAPLALGWGARRWLLPRLEGSPWRWPARTGAWALAAVLVFLFYRTSAYDFVYFQF